MKMIFSVCILLFSGCSTLGFGDFGSSQTLEGMNAAAGGTNKPEEGIDSIKPMKGDASESFQRY